MRVYYSFLQLLADLDPLVGREGLGAVNLCQRMPSQRRIVSTGGKLTAQSGRRQRGQ